MNYEILIKKFGNVITKFIKKHEKRKKRRLKKLGKSIDRALREQARLRSDPINIPLSSI
jgi:hypothetical protein